MHLKKLEIEFSVGVHGIIVYSDDEGETWTQAETVPFTKTLTDISCPSQNKCWAVGHDATILHSFDGGKSWEIQYQDVDFDAPFYLFICMMIMKGLQLVHLLIP